MNVCENSGLLPYFPWGRHWIEGPGWCVVTSRRWRGAWAEAPCAWAPFPWAGPMCGLAVETACVDGPSGCEGYGASGCAGAHGYVTATNSTRQG